VGGNFMYHCHILEHEDSGMMGMIRVGEPVQVASAKTKAKTAGNLLAKSFDKNKTTGKTSSTPLAQNRVKPALNGGAPAVAAGLQTASVKMPAAQLPDAQTSEPASPQGVMPVALMTPGVPEMRDRFGNIIPPDICIPRTRRVKTTVIAPGSTAI
jgi:hypothetical protein